MWFLFLGLLVLFLGCPCNLLLISGLDPDSSGICWKNIKVPKVRTVPKQFPTEERYLDYDCYYRTWQKYSCYKIRHSFRYDYVTEDYIDDERVQTCCESYESYTEAGNSEVLCRPICEKECIYGSCVSPNVCQCSPGYVLVNELDPNICEPHCDECVNGVCSSPNVCDCIEGYSASLRENYCTPVCNPACVHGQCTEPNKCSCYSGYSRTDETHCTPECTQPCQGICTAPEVCTCRDDYHQINNTHCLPRCEPVCNNGVCIAPQVCHCFDHYEKVDNFTCRPSCETPCINSHCTDINVCSCHPGYVKVNASYCAPVCASPCVNGDCVAPDRCYCSPGFQYVNGSYCEPYCEYCHHGKCVAPNLCQCDQGFRSGNVTGVCERMCEEVCENGTCINNRCFCKEGDRNPYCNIPCDAGLELNPRTRHCQPQCTNCSRGFCLKPNVCSCPRNYRLVNDSCEVDELFKEVYANLLDLYIGQEMYLSCKSDMMSSFPGAIDIGNWSVNTYELMRCNSQSGDDSERFSCIEECDLKLLSNNKTDFVSIKCTLYNNYTLHVKYGSVECTATRIVESAGNSPMPPMTTTQPPSSTLDLSNTETSTLESTITTIDSLTTYWKVFPELKSEKSSKVFFECRNSTLEVSADKTTRVFVRYFTSKILDHNVHFYFNHTSQPHITIIPHNLNSSERMNSSDVLNSSESVANRSGDDPCSLLCPSEHHMMTVTLLDGTQLLAPVVSCYEDHSKLQSSASTHKLLLLSSYICAGALVCLILVALAVRHFMASKRVFYVKGRTCGDGAIEQEETDEIFRLSGGQSEE